MNWSNIFSAKRAINQVIKLGWNELTRSILGEMCWSWFKFKFKWQGRRPHDRH